MIPRIDQKYKSEIVGYLYALLDSDRVGSDEINCVEDILNQFESISLNNMSIDDVMYVRKEIIGMKNWSDRLGSDENYFINRIIKITDYLVS